MRPTPPVSVLLLSVSTAPLAAAGTTSPHTPERVRAYACADYIVSELDMVAANQGWRIGWMVQDPWTELEGPCNAQTNKALFPTPTDRRPVATARELVATHETLSGRTLFEVDEVSERVVLIRQVHSNGHPIDQPWAAQVTLPSEPTSAKAALENLLVGWPGDAAPIVACAPRCTAKLTATDVSYDPGTTLDFGAAVFAILDDVDATYVWGLTKTPEGGWFLGVEDPDALRGGSPTMPAPLTPAVPP